MITTVTYTEAEATRLCATINEHTKPKIVASFHEGHSIDDLGRDGGPVFNVTIDLPLIEWWALQPSVQASVKAKINPTLTFDPE